MTDTTSRATHWSLTINNPTADDEECLQLARQRGWKIDGQKERGEGGTEHYQLHLQTPQVRFSAVKKMFPRAHIEVARNPSALALYVTKEETRVGELARQQDRYPSQAKFFELVWDVILLDDGNAIPEFSRGSNNRFPRPINALNRATDTLIRLGYHVEGMASNPMTIACWKQFHDALLARKIAGETSRQPDVRLIPEDSSPPQEYNHASQDVSQEARVQAPPPPPCPSCGKSHSHWEACPPVP